MDVKFGMLQKTKSNAIKNNSYNQIANSMLRAENIFEQYNQYQSELKNSNGANNEQNPQALSVAELENKMAELEQEFNQYYTTMNEQKNSQQNSDSNEDEKNKKVEFKSFMA